MDIKCVECGVIFAMNKGELDFYKSKGFDLPKRCKECRKLKKYKNMNQAQLSVKECGEKQIEHLLKEYNYKTILLGDINLRIMIKLYLLLEMDLISCMG